MPPAIRVENLGKRYRLGETHGSLRELINSTAGRLLGRRHGGPSKPKPPTGSPGQIDDEGCFWALNDVSFEIQPGEVVGIIGRNGAGKSTLLKILSRIVTPTTGRIELNGRIASLLEVGTGFHPELTGRENVFLNGAILGMTKAEVRKNFEAIVDFAEIEQFIDTPVKRYSSGMYVRLAFAVAAHLDPEILVVDEVLAVGDLAFQQKCLGKINTVARSGRTVLFVSHNLQALAQITTRCVLLESGSVAEDGPTDKILKRFRYLLTGQDDDTSGKYLAPPHKQGNYLTSAHVRTSDDDSVHRFGKPLQFEFALTVTEPQESLCFSFQIVDRNNANVTYAWLTSHDIPFRHQPGAYLLKCLMPNSHLYMGTYSVNTFIAERKTHTVYELLNGICPFIVSMEFEPSPEYPWHPDAAIFLEPFSWHVEKRSAFTNHAIAGTPTHL